jgi:hypothetical protein
VAVKRSVTRGDDVQDADGCGLRIVSLPSLLLAFLFIVVPYHMGMEVIHRTRWWWRHGLHGKRYLVVYSDHARWKPWIERELLPLLGDRAVIVRRTTDLDWREPKCILRSAWHQWSSSKRLPLVVYIPLVGFKRKLAVDKVGRRASRRHEHALSSALERWKALA